MADKVPTADVTIGFLDVLGVKPRWGRPFVSGDESASEFAVLVSPRLARKYFGDPIRALGQLLETTAGPHRVVGVMPEGFGVPHRRATRCGAHSIPKGRWRETLAQWAPWPTSQLACRKIDCRGSSPNVRSRWARLSASHPTQSRCRRLCNRCGPGPAGRLCLCCLARRCACCSRRAPMSPASNWLPPSSGRGRTRCNWRWVHHARV